MSRRGAALAVVLFAMALISALVVGAVYASRSMVTSARFSRSGSSLEGPAVRALLSIVARWDSAARAEQPLASDVAVSREVIDGIEVATWITRLSPETWWLVAESVGGTEPGFTRRIGLLVHDSAGVLNAVPGPAWAQLP